MSRAILETHDSKSKAIRQAMEQALKIFCIKHKMSLAKVTEQSDVTLFAILQRYGGLRLSECLYLRVANITPFKGMTANAFRRSHTANAFFSLLRSNAGVSTPVGREWLS